MSNEPTLDPQLAVGCHNVVRVYGELGSEIVALRGADLDVTKGEALALLGPSGAGKSTLMWLIAGLQRPTAGQVIVAGELLREQSEAKLARLRARHVGVLLQNPARNLLTYATAGDNLLFAQRTMRSRGRDKAKRAAEMLESVGLSGVASARSGALSGGEQQRLGLAVALVNRPQILLADEPTSQLDSSSARDIVDLLLEVNRHQGTTVIVVTHDPVVAAAMDRTVTIRDGRIGAEGHGGREYVVIGRDGEVHLPTEVLDLLPPGSLAKVTRTATGVELDPADPEMP